MTELFKTNFVVFYCLLTSSLGVILKFPLPTFFLDFSLTFLSLYIVSLLNTKKLYFSQNTKPIEKRYFLWGDFFKSDNDKKKEEDLFLKLSLNKKIKRLLAGLFVLLVGSTVSIFLLDFKGIYISPICALIILSTYWRHLYFIFILKVIFTVMYASNSGVIDRQFICLILGILLMSIILFSKKIIKISHKTCFKFVMISVFIVSVFPETKQEAEINEIKKERIIKMKRTKINLGLGKLDLKIKAQASHLDDEVDAMISQIDSMEALLMNFPDIGIELKEDLSNTRIELIGLKEELKNNISQGTMSSGSVKKLLNRMKKIKGKSIFRFKSGSLDPEKLKEFNRSGQSFKEGFDGGVEDLIDSLKNVEESLLLKENLEDKKSQVDNEVLSDDAEKFNTNRIIEVFWLASLFVFIIYIKSLFNRKESRILNSTEISAINKELKVLRSLKLSANEEIIRSYNIWREKVHRAYFEGQEVPPPMNLAKYFSSSKGKLRSSLFQISRIFCDCYYGDLNAKTKDLKEFRRNMIKILSH